MAHVELAAKAERLVVMLRTRGLAARSALRFFADTPTFVLRFAQVALVRGPALRGAEY
jgi:hypothetical protein